MVQCGERSGQPRGHLGQKLGLPSQTGTAPIALGEFGTKLETTFDKQWLDTLVGYLGLRA